MNYIYTYEHILYLDGVHINVAHDFPTLAQESDGALDELSRRWSNASGDRVGRPADFLVASCGCWKMVIHS